MDPTCHQETVLAGGGSGMLWGVCVWRDMISLIRLDTTLTDNSRGSRSIVACLVTSSSPVPLKIRRVGQRCTLNLLRVETFSRWCGVVVRERGASSGVIHVT
ncbi:uncharacterized protein TNCV_4657691 [Trichonephila clavipes]|nr:uncharacterized protein TNCV_4657691 [Trichonephila clavipes]